VRPERRCVRYSHVCCVYFCCLYPQVSIAQLLFEFGVLLPDPEGLLEGDGSHVRFVTVWANQPLRAPALRRLVTAAYDLPRKRLDKLALVDAVALQRQYDEWTIAAGARTMYQSCEKLLSCPGLTFQDDRIVVRSVYP